jgi:hypothetical protein
LLKPAEPPLCVLARPRIKLFGRDRISARDLLGAYLAGRDSPEDSHLSTGRPPHISTCVWKTIGPLRIVGHVSLPAINHCRRFISTFGYIWIFLVNGARGTCRRRCEQGELVTADFEERSFSAGDQELGAVVWELGAGYLEQGPRGQAEMTAPQAHLPVMKNLELSDDEAKALVRVLGEAIDSDRYPLSPRVMMLKEILAKLRPEPARPAASPEPRVYAPPSRGRYRRRRG